MQKFDEKTLSQERVYDGKFIQVRKDFVEISTGQKRLREVVEHPGGVVVVALKDENTTKETKILMVKQYRYPIKQPLFELPAGRLEIGESPDECIVKELEEETGHIAKTWKSLGYIYTSPGICDEKLYLYLATDLKFKKQNLEEGEILEYFEYKLDDVFAMIKNGEINDAKTICALMRAFKI